MVNACGIIMNTAEEARKKIGVGKNKIYELMNDGSLEHIDIGGRKRITDQQIRDFISRATVRRETPNLYAKR